MQKIKCEFVAELIGSNTRGNKIRHGSFPQLGKFEATQVTIRVRAKTLLYGAEFGACRSELSIILKIVTTPTCPAPSQMATTTPTASARGFE